MIRICFLMIAHKNINQIKRLLNYLRTDFDLYVHIDKKVNLNIESEGNIHIYKKFKVAHGGISQITATLFLLKEAIKNNYDRYIFISGQDMPLKSNNYIKKFFEENMDKEYISYINIEEDKNFYGEMSFRISGYNFGKLYRKVLSRKIRELISNLPFLKREMPKNIYFGSQWWNFTNNAVRYILDFVKNNPDYLNRFKYTWGADEVFFQSILMSSYLSEKCVNDCLRHIVWGIGVPTTFLKDDYGKLVEAKKTEALFARKFDEKIDYDIIDMLYRDLS